MAVAGDMPTTPPPAMPPGFNTIDVDLEPEASAAAGTTATSSENVSMGLLMQLMKQMTEMIIAEKVNGGARMYLANTKLDERNFKRIEKFTNTRDAWKEWKVHFMTCVRECDTSFGDFLWGIEKRPDEICLMSLDPTETQLAAALYSRLISVNTGEVFRIVEMTRKETGCKHGVCSTNATTRRPTLA